MTSPVDPTIGAPERRKPGRPARTTLEKVVDAAIELGLDRFTLAGVAAHIGVGESTVYNYVTGRAQLHAAAAAAVFARLDLDVDVPTDDWVGYLDAVAERCFDLARRHPGLRDYVLFGPYEPSTVATFEAIVERVRTGLPDTGAGEHEHTAFVVASRPIVLTLTYVGDPVLESSAPWLRRALLRGLAAAVEAGDLPPDPPASWRGKVSPAAARSRR